MHCQQGQMERAIKKVWLSWKKRRYQNEMKEVKLYGDRQEVAEQSNRTISRTGL